MINEIPFHSQGIDLMNKLGKVPKPFLFLIDYKAENAIILSLDEIDNNLLCYDLNGLRNFELPILVHNSPVQFNIHPISEEIYERGYNRVMKNIIRGNSFLWNGENWITLLRLLLKGVRRASLIDLQTVRVADIYLKDLPFFQSIRLFNAMILFEEACDVLIDSVHL